ncbi:hypothetical protein NMY22_g2773 [Coprinellus aureogranulatus]|nr:hypothetical protein NMY22_g2773 [Coprinellus aureogranulatus]
MPSNGYNSLLDSSAQYELLRNRSRRTTVMLALTAVFVITLFAQLLPRSTRTETLRTATPTDEKSSTQLDVPPWLVPSSSLNFPHPTVLGRDNLRNDSHYLTAFPVAAFTNKVIAYMHLIYLAVITQRIPIVPPMIPPGWVPIDAGMIPFGELFNLTTLRANLRHPVLEWAEVKAIPSNASVEVDTELSDPTVEDFGCWSTNKRTVGSPTWVKGAENVLRIDMSFTRIPDFAYMNESNKAEVHTTFPALSSLVWPKHPNAATRNLPLMAKSRLHQHSLPPDEQLACFDLLYFVTSGVKPYEFEQRWSPAWNTVGTNMRFTQPLMDLAEGYLRRALKIDDGSVLPPMITVHIRRNDWKIKCQEGQTPPCYIPVSHYQRAVDDVRRKLRETRNTDVTQVYVASDETDPYFWQEISSLGWIYFDHAAEQTVERLGAWYPLLIDKVALSMGTGFVGTRSSTFSVLSAMRVEDWNNGITTLGFLAKHVPFRFDIVPLGNRRFRRTNVDLTRVMAVLVRPFVHLKYPQALSPILSQRLVRFEAWQKCLSREIHQVGHPLGAYCALTMTTAVPPVYERVFNNAELTTHIFHYLRTIKYEEAQVPDSEDDVPQYPAQWTQYFARLARINRTFFHASISILWEKMNTLVPFFYTVLPADRDEEGNLCNPPAYAMSLITPEHWHRFELYASKTKVLVLNRPETEPMSDGWLLHLAMSKSRPDPLFPQLNQLTIRSNDKLSLFVAHSSGPYAKSVTIDFDKDSDEQSEEAGASLAATLCANSAGTGRLKLLRLFSPHDSQYALRNICLCPSIATLLVRIGPNSNEVDFTNFAKCTSLEGLVIGQHLPPTDNTSSSPELWPTKLKIQDLIATSADLPNLQAARITCNALSHFLAAERLCLKSLTWLILEVMLDSFDEQLLLLPLVLAIHTARNPSLSHLEFTCPKYDVPAAESIGTRRNEWVYMDFKPMYTGLKGLQHLTTLRIVKIPFLCVDVVDRILDVVLELPNLQVLALSPRSITSLEADMLALPPLSRLEDVARKGKKLVSLQLAVDFNDIPVVPNNYVPAPGLVNLKFDDILEEGTVHLEYFTSEDLLTMGRYLDRLFPNLKSLTAGWEKGSDQWQLWDYMEKLVRSFQDLRAEARKELQAFSGAQATI